MVHSDARLLNANTLQVEESSEFLPLVYDPASISTYWGKRPQAVATRVVQLLSVAGGFLSRLAGDVIKKKVKEVLLFRSFVVYNLWYVRSVADLSIYLK